MTIAAITGTRTENDLSGIFPEEGIYWKIVKTVEEVETVSPADLYLDLDFTAETSRCRILSRLLPSPVIVNAVIPTLTDIGYPFVRINGWPGFLERPVHEGVAPDPETEFHIKGLYEQLGRSLRFVKDTPGMISARILATIINEACFTWEADVSSKEEIDIAMRLGTNYPLGPFEWGRQIGLEKIEELLRVLSEKDKRYTPSESLKKRDCGLKYD